MYRNNHIQKAVSLLSNQHAQKTSQMDLLHQSGNAHLNNAMTNSKLSGFATSHGTYAPPSRQMIDNWHSTSATKKRSLIGLHPDKVQESKIVSQRIDLKRPKPKMFYKGTESSDDENDEAFTASPADDIPKNKLTDKLVRGL